MFLSPVLATFLVVPFQITPLPNFCPPEIQMGTLDRGREIRCEGNKSFPQAQLILLPFQNAPGPRSSSVDREDPDSSLNDSVNNLSPYGKPDPPPSLETHQGGIRFDRCIDTDLCVFIIPGKSNSKGRRIVVELFRTNVPHLRANCEQEKELATDAMETMQGVLTEASQIDVYDHYKVGRKHMARVVGDGQDLSELLMSQGLATLQGHGKKDWCTE